VPIVTATGTPLRGWTRPSRSGSSRSRAITKKIRVWPNRKARITVGSATTATAPKIFAVPAEPSVRSTSASGSAESAKRATGTAPIAQAATPM
jgi:hypothetical protein